VVLGPLEEVVARVTLVDRETGRTIGVANCIGRTSTRMNLGPKLKAEGLAKAVVLWLRSHNPVPEGQQE
jgi:hypothetical protein